MFNPPTLTKTKSLKQGAYEYSQQQKLGEGAFAKVYKGRIMKNNRVVAVRLLPLTLIKQYGDRIKDIITGEVSVLKELSMSEDVDALFTTRIYDCFMTSNNVVMILQFCPEGNLEDIVKKGPLDQKQALEIVLQIARGLEFCARQKVVHRDIKPDNIFIKKQGQHKIFKLGDFGFAVKKQLNSQIVGTPIFMSPQLFRQDSYGSEVDVWAFGLMVHYILFKEYYFIANSEMQIKKRVLGERYELKKHHLAKISKEMADFLTQCLKFDKRDRIPATKLSSHAVFNPVRQKIQRMIKQVTALNTSYQTSLVKSTAKGKITNQILKHSFLMDLASTFSTINPYNYASLYILKHSLAELSSYKTKLISKQPFPLNPPLSPSQYSTFCSSDDHQKTCNLLKHLLQKCEQNFQSTFNRIIPQIRSQFGEQASTGLQQNLGHGPYSPINPQLIVYQLQNNWFPWLQQNKNKQTHLLGLELILALHIYEKKGVDFDYMGYEMGRANMGIEGRIGFLEATFRGQ